MVRLNENAVMELSTEHCDPHNLQMVTSTSGSHSSQKPISCKKIPVIHKLRLLLEYHCTIDSKDAGLPQDLVTSRPRSVLSPQPLWCSERPNGRSPS